MIVLNPYIQQSSIYTTKRKATTTTTVLRIKHILNTLSFAFLHRYCSWRSTTTDKKIRQLPELLPSVDGFFPRQHHYFPSLLRQTKHFQSTSNNCKSERSHYRSHTAAYSSSQMSMSTNDITVPYRPILVIGSANYDITSYTSTVPQMGETVMGDTKEQIDLSCGGKGANQAKAAACIVHHPSHHHHHHHRRVPDNNNQSSLVEGVQLICRVGNDIFGKEILQNLQNFGVLYDKEQTMITDGKIRTGVASIIVHTQNGNNQIVVSPGANYMLSSDDVRNVLQKYQTAATMPILLLQMEILHDTIEAAIRIGRENDSTMIIVNPAPVPNDINILRELKESLFPLIDILIPNESELRLLYSCNDSTTTENTDEIEMATSLLNEGIRSAVIVTLGERGALIAERTMSDTTTNVRTTYIQAPDEIRNSNDPVIDTVGAGDAFCGALAAYLSMLPPSSSSDTAKPCTIPNLVDICRMACGYATLSVRRRGADYPRNDAIPSTLHMNTLLPASSIEQINASVSDQPTVLTFVTGNVKKLEEVRQILGASTSNFPYTITNQKIDLPELQGNDVYEIAKEKCRIASSMIDGPCFIEDTSLCFNALHGLPGPYIKWFLEKCGHSGLNQMLAGFDDNSAYAQTVIAYTDGIKRSNNDNNNNTDIEIHVFDGRTDGNIVLPRGNLDFGWDPIFEPIESHGLTYAEMDKASKNAISHRGRSFQKFQSFLIERSKEASMNSKRVKIG